MLYTDNSIDTDIVMQTNGSLDTGYSIQCSRGEEECIGNTIQACTVHYIQDKIDQVSVILYCSDIQYIQTLILPGISNSLHVCC